MTHDRYFLDNVAGWILELNRGQGIHTILATATRGDGGQNEIGPEIFDALAVLRTEELGAMHRFDATEQYFTRAVDFGYSFSIEETLEKWGRDEIIGDSVRLIRMTRPDVIHGMNPTGTAGGLHHQSSGLLSREAFKAAGDPARYPEQLREGLRPWQPRKFYFTFGGPGGGGGPRVPAVGPPPVGPWAPRAVTISPDPKGHSTTSSNRKHSIEEGHTMTVTQGRRASHAVPTSTITKFASEVTIVHRRSESTVDVRLSKIVRIGALRITGFWEMFNALNTDNFVNYAGSLESSSFGQPLAALDKKKGGN